MGTIIFIFNLLVGILRDVNVMTLIGMSCNVTKIVGHSILLNIRVSDTEYEAVTVRRLPGGSCDITPTIGLTPSRSQG